MLLTIGTVRTFPLDIREMQRRCGNSACVLRGTVPVPQEVEVLARSSRKSSCESPSFSGLSRPAASIRHFDYRRFHSAPMGRHRDGNCESRGSAVLNYSREEASPRNYCRGTQRACRDDTAAATMADRYATVIRETRVDAESGVLAW